MRRILAVDDIEYNLELIKDIFHDQVDLIVITARNGKEVFEVLQEKNDIGIDLILLDLSMPIMDGFEVLQRLQVDPTLSLIPVIVVTANADEKIKALQLGASDFISKPYDIVELKLRATNYIHIGQYQRYLNETNLYLEKKVTERTLQLQQALALSKKTEYEISLRLGKASEYRDTETGMHIKRMSLYSERLAQLLGLDDYECELIRYAAPLHDVGKVGIKDNILLKPGKLTKEEFEIMKTHTLIGGEILDNADKFPVINMGQIIALQHHEKYDGSGYPYGLKGSEIHLYARIVAIADVFDALSSVRVYKKAFSIQESLTIMRSERGKQFDPKLFDLFIENICDFIAIKEKYQDTSRDS
jgi:putative two-component system response regulator